MKNMKFFKSERPPMIPFEPIKFTIRIDDDSNEENINALLAITLSVISLSAIYFLLFPFLLKFISPNEERIREDNLPVIPARFRAAI